MFGGVLPVVFGEQGRRQLGTVMFAPVGLGFGEAVLRTATFQYRYAVHSLKHSRGFSVEYWQRVSAPVKGRFFSFLLS